MSAINRATRSYDPFKISDPLKYVQCLGKEIAYSISYRLVEHIAIYKSIANTVHEKGYIVVIYIPYSSIFMT